MSADRAGGSGGAERQLDEVDPAGPPAAPSSLLRG
jgi:hypothetical protein